MTAIIRECRPDDAEACGQICYTAFKAVADEHNFPPDFPNTEFATGMLSQLIAHPGFYGVVAEVDGIIAGSNFLDERSAIAGLGPITVAPNTQNRTVGRDLMSDVMNRAKIQGFPGVRLVQAAYHNRSFSLYSKLGFDVQVPLALMQGETLSRKFSGYDVRPARSDDLGKCNKLCHQVHGHDRGGDLSDAISQEVASVVEYEGRVVGYSTGIAYLGHSVAESNNGLKALIGAAAEFQGLGFLVPTTNHELFRWCLLNGLRVVQVMNLMTVGLYNQPQGSYLSSVLY